MLTSLILASVSVLATGTLAGEPSDAAPYIQLWTDKDEVFEQGDAVRVYFETDTDAYVTVFRIDTDGRVRVLFPLDPWDDNYARGGVRYQIEARRERHTFRVDDYPGQGYLFAVASADPFSYAPYVRADHWDYLAIAADGRIVGDPYVALGDVIDHIIPANYVAYSYDVLPYHVERRYEYPRFLCYDCHTYAAWPYWDPYAHSCVRFRIVIYDDPYYYPARVYAGTRVVYRPRRTAVVPRYVFKDRQPDDRYVVRVRERPVDAEGRRRIDPGATRRGLGQPTRLPAPLRRDVTLPADATAGRRLVAPSSERRVRPQPGQAPQLERRDPRKPPARRSTGRQPPERRTQPASPPTRRQAVPRRQEPRSTPQTDRRRRDPRSAPRANSRRNEPSASPPKRRNPPARHRT